MLKPVEFDRATETTILDIVKKDHRVGLAIAAVPRIGISLHDYEAVAHRANIVQGQVVDVLGMKGVILRQVAPELIGELVNALDHTKESNGAGRYMMLRHGGQRLDQETGDLKGASQKIRLMQIPHNREDPLTDQSIAEAVGFGLVLACISTEINLPLQVRTSYNKRAAEVAAVIARISGGTVKLDDRLTCVNYPSQESKSDQEIDNLLGSENKGSLRWNKAIVDRVVGPGTFDTITNKVAVLIDEGLAAKQYLVIDVTHTQQTNAADVQADREPSRLGEMGFSVWRSPRASTLLPNGIFLP